MTKHTLSTTFLLSAAPLQPQPPSARHIHRAENTFFRFPSGCFQPLNYTHRLIDQQPSAESIPRETAARRRDEAG